MNKLDPERRAYILHSLCEGYSQRSCERIYGVSNKTIAKLFEEAGDMAIEYVANMAPFFPDRIQADELHAFVGARQKNVPEMLLPFDEAGETWAYLAMCPDTKLIFAYYLGGHTLEDATTFAKKIRSKLKRDAHGCPLVRPTLVTDGLPPYPEAFRQVFGDEIDYGQLKKRYSNIGPNGEKVPRRYVGADRIPIIGSPDAADIQTSIVERQNLNLRMQNRRYTRKSNGFSKTMLNHERHLALWIMYHNLCWIPCPSRPRRDAQGNRGKNWQKRLPAAIAAGLEDRLWAIEDLLAATDAFVAARAELAAANDDIADDVGLEEAGCVEVVSDAAPTHWVYHSHAGHTAKVHAAHCCNCRDGKGKRDTPKQGEEWLPFHSLEAAKAAAERLEPGRDSTCNMCVGSYRTLGYRHAGSSRQSPVAA